MACKPSNPAAVPSLEGALVYPDDDGTANWFSPSFNTKTGLFYQNVREKGAIQKRTHAVFKYTGIARSSLSPRLRTSGAHFRPSRNFCDFHKPAPSKAKEKTSPCQQ